MLRRLFCLAIAVAGAGVAMPALADPDFASKYGARSPATCPAERSSPDTLDAQSALTYVLCDNEYYDAHDNFLMLHEGTPLSVGAPRAFRIGKDPSDADSSQPVQDIKEAQSSEYACQSLNGINGGTNCAIITTSNATGVCYRDRDHAWHCKLGGADYTRRSGPPPAP